MEKVAAGAVGKVGICRVTNLRSCLLELRELGYWSTGLTPTAPQSLFGLDFPGRTALVLGGETGMRPLVMRTCDRLARIPQEPGVESLNAAVAGAIAMYELARQTGRLDRYGDRW